MTILVRRAGQSLFAPFCGSVGFDVWIPCGAAGSGRKREKTKTFLSPFRVQYRRAGNYRGEKDFSPANVAAPSGLLC